MNWNVENGITFGNKHSFRDFGLYLKDKPDLPAPNVKEIRIELMGADGDIDITEAYGPVRYDNIKAQFVFSILGNRRRWENVYSNVKNYLHGKRMNVVLDEVPEFYYVGRLTVGQMSYKLDKMGADLTAYIPITGEFYPYKFEVVDSSELWKWDPFNFDTGVIRQYSELTVGNETTYTFINNRMPVIPTFTVTAPQGSLTVEFEGETYVLANGTTKNADIIFHEGENELTFTGYGTVTVNYRGGSL